MKVLECKAAHFCSGSNKSAARFHLPVTNMLAPEVVSRSLFMESMCFPQEAFNIYQALLICYSHIQGTNTMPGEVQLQHKQLQRAVFQWTVKHQQMIPSHSKTF